jgi:hypothetical protein
MLFVDVAFKLLPAIKELNIGSVAIKGHGCRGGNAQLCGLNGSGRWHGKIWLKAKER